MKRNTAVNRTGFTLIELLVVIAIIALLAAILFPVFARARDNARRATCMSNLKQIGLGILQYNQDYDGRFPQVFSTNVPLPPDGVEFFPGAKYSFWQQIIYPYVKSHQIYYCPSSPARPGTSIPSLGSSEPLATMLNANYSYSGHIGGEDGMSKKESAIVDAAGTYLFMEFGNYEFAKYYVNLASYNDSGYIRGQACMAKAVQWQPLPNSRWIAKRVATLEGSQSLLRMDTSNGSEVTWLQKRPQSLTTALLILL